jgi:hypothetical protein
LEQNTTLNFNRYLGCINSTNRLYKTDFEKHSGIFHVLLISKKDFKNPKPLEKKAFLGFVVPLKR